MKISLVLLAAGALIILSSAKVLGQSNQHNHIKTEATKNNSQVESIVREGTIDLKLIDKNKDGKVFQDQMDWNVISDEAGKCPLCKMTLKEVKIKEAKGNLSEHNFKVKG